MDTLKAAQELQSGGFTRKQAEMIAKVMNEIGRADLVTKADLWQHTVAIILANAAITTLLFKFLS